MSIYSEWKPRKVLEEIYEECRRKRSLPSIRPILAEKLIARGTGKSDDLRKFTHIINGQKWVGFIYNKRNSLMGSTFGFYKSKFTVIRGYPKIKYAEESRVIGKEVITEYKVDGTNLGIWTFQDGSIMGKTRLVERWDTEGWHGRNWRDIFERTNLTTKMTELCKEDYQVFGELYGKENEGEFIKYTVPIAFSVLDIMDRRNFGFLDRDAKVKLCNHYELPLVEENWRGVLTEKEIERLEFQAKELLKEDGYEGFVAKSYVPEDKDVYFCYSNDTEILTPFGWKRGKDILIGDEIFTFNLDKEKLEEDKALFIISYPYSGKLLNLRSENVDLFITPNHRVLHKRRKPKLDYNYGDWEISFAKNLPHKLLIPCSYEQEDKKDYAISDDIIKIIAWIITEGHLERNNDGIRISQYEKVHQQYVDEIMKSLTNLSWEFSYRKGQEFRIKAQYGKIAREILGNYKHIPEDWISKFSNRQLKLLLDTLMKGDGKLKDSVFNQKSIQIRDEFQHILTRLGFKNTNHSRKIENLSYVTFSEKHTEEVNTKQWISYNGIVWCITTKNGFLVTRRNGKVNISGNCKLKCQEVRERCWGMSSGFTIPSSIIMKAVQKATENLTNFNSKDEFEKFVREELLEEASEELVTKSKDKIKRIVERKMAIQVNDEEIIKFLDEMTSLPASITGISIDILDDRNKRHIMKTLADKFIGFKPATLYQIYDRYKKTKRKEKTLGNIVL